MDHQFHHEALPYPGRDAFVASCSAVVREGLERDERMLVLAQADKVDEVRDELGASAHDVTFVPTDEHGRNPSRIMTMLHSFTAGGDGRHAVGVNETVYSGRHPTAQQEAQFSDFVLNDPALRSWPLSVVCLFDTDTLDGEALTAMRRCHPVIRGEDANADYLPDLMTAMYAEPFAPPPLRHTRLEVGGPELTTLRAFVRAEAGDLGAAADRVDDLVLAANEVVTNSLRHGGGHADVQMWLAGDSIVCQVSDRGHIRDPLVGRLAPVPSATSGRGLWLTNHLCDLVQIRSSDVGTTVRMFVDR